MVSYEIIDKLANLEISEKVPVTLKGFVHSHRVGKSVSFLVLRQGITTLQCVYSKKDLKADDEKITNQSEETLQKKHEINSNSLQKDLSALNLEEDEHFKTNFLNSQNPKKKNKSERKPRSTQVTSRYGLYTKIPVESYVKVNGFLSNSPVPILSCTIRHLELQISSIESISISSELPFTFKISTDLEIGKNEIQEESKSAIINEKCKNTIESKISNSDSKRIQIGSKQNSNDDNQIVSTKLDTLLDNRYLDLRLPHTHSIFTIIDGFYFHIRNFLRKRDFIEIKTPKIIQGSTEGGANLFEVEYFKKVAYLAQSPQLYKQMAVIGGLQRIYEIGHVYRQEESNTNRYLSEFVGLDLELEVESHLEVINLVFDMIKSIFEGVQEDYKKEMDIVRGYYPFEDVILSNEPVILSFVGCKRLLNEFKNANKFKNSSFPIQDSDYILPIQDSDSISLNQDLDALEKFNQISTTNTSNVSQKTSDDIPNSSLQMSIAKQEQNNTNQADFDNYTSLKIIAEKIYADSEIDEYNKTIPDLLKDFNREEERKLGKIVKEIYKTDLFVVQEYPTHERAFYTSAKDSIFSNSFDFILRGEEILSGALRIHDLLDLKKSLKTKNIDEKSLDGYLKAFRNGVPMHGGCGIGFERMVKCFFGGNDIRLFTMFPRDPNRLYP